LHQLFLIGVSFHVRIASDALGDELRLRAKLVPSGARTTTSKWLFRLRFSNF
jgi:hypothetical protein